MLPRSTGSLLMSPSPSQDALYNTSPVSDYSVTLPEPPAGHRQSTGASTSEALQYYWSSSAGERSNSISSNLGVSPIESPNPNIPLHSPYTLSPNALSMSPHSTMHQAHSNLSLRELVHQEAEHERMMRSGAFADAPDDDHYEQLAYDDPPRPRHTSSEAGPSNRHIHLYGSDSNVNQLANSTPLDTPPSPTGSSNSGESEYSLPDDNAAAGRAGRSLQTPRDDVPKPRQGSFRGERPRGLVDTEGSLDVLLDPSFEEWAHQRLWDGSAPSPSTSASGSGTTVTSPLSPITPVGAPTSRETSHTPTNSLLDRRRFSPSDSRTPSPAHHDTTPRSSVYTPRASAARAPAKSSGRTLFLGSEVPRRSLDALERDVAGLLGTPGRSTPRGANLDEHDPPHSAPAHKTAFGDIGTPPDRLRPTSLLPSVNMPSPNPPSSSQLSLPAQINPRRSPEPPPRSELRKQRSRTPEPERVTDSPTTIEFEQREIQKPTAVRTQTLPTIINTPNTPISSPQQRGRGPGGAGTSPRANTAPPLHGVPTLSSRSPSPGPGLRSSGTIQDLSELIGGAIDEIGLMDSRDTPPVIEPERRHTPLMLSQVPARTASANATQSQAQAVPQAVPGGHTGNMETLSPTSSAFSQPASSSRSSHSTSPIGLGIMSSVGASMIAAGSAATQRTANAARHVRKASSILSLRSSNYSLTSPTAAAFAAAGPAMPLPQAIMFGTIKNLKTPGDRARAYARATAALLTADSGLQQWCTEMENETRSTIRPGKQAVISQLGLRTPDAPTPRNVSASSEFPTRADAFTAREISVRHLDPGDAPTALPANLPYPQLQSVKASGSMQSLASVSSTANAKARSGLRGMMGKLRRDKESNGLGPPNGGVMLNPAAMGSKRDLRNMPISPPSFGGRSSMDSLDGRERVQPSLPAPRGPREVPRRSSMDVVPLARSSVDSSRPIIPRTQSGLGLIPPQQQPSPLGRDREALHEMRRQQDNAPSEEDVRHMCDMLPQSERAVVRAYLSRFGESSVAMTAYLEDEKHGQLMRV